MLHFTRLEISHSIAGGRCRGRPLPASVEQRRKVFWSISIMVLFLCLLLPVYSHSQEGRGEPKTITALQQFRKTTSMTIENNTGQRGVATLINLNPRINTWFLVQLAWADGHGDGSYHLENGEPARQELLLDPEYPHGIVIAAAQNRYSCDLWSGFSPLDLAGAKASHNTYAPLCDGRLYLRNKTAGYKTTKELVTDWLRDYVWDGERTITFVRENFYQDAFLKTSEVTSAKTLEMDGRLPSPSTSALPLISSRYDNHSLVPTALGITLENKDENRVLVGHWYRVQDQPGIFISTIQSQMVSEEIIQRQQNRGNPLDKVESTALVYLVAFDLNQFELGFAMGTEHPRVDWSNRIREGVRDNSLPGPDGIGTVAPLVRTGMVNPANVNWIAATFTGGFKRYHGAFRWGDLAFKNRGSHYGFIENGVVMSKLQSGLATAIVFDDGTVELKTWTEQDNANLASIRHARQNGVPVIEYDEATGTATPGALVPRWGPGNWSGSADKELRTLRAGLCLQEHENHRFLIYGYFSSVTPSAMARVFQAYRCRYAMHLDMNALEHTYLAVYQVRDSHFLIQHLIAGMSALDKSNKGQVVPRFVGYADNRDFFYLLRRTTDEIPAMQSAHNITLQHSGRAGDFSERP